MNKIVKFYLILNSSQKKSLFFLIFLMGLGMVFETVGIGLLIPAVNMLLQYEKTTYHLVIERYIDISMFDQLQLFVIGVTFLLGFFLLKVIFLTFLSWNQSKFAFSIQETTSLRIYHQYITKPYKFFMDENSSKVIKNTINECVNLSSITVATSLILSEFFVIIGLSTLLIYYKPFAALTVIFTLILLSLSFYLLTRSKLLSWGKLRAKFDNERIKQIQTGFGGIKEIKILNREDQFLASYQEQNAGLAKVSTFYMFLSQLPRFWLEFFAVFGLLLLILILNLQGFEVESIVTVLAIFAAAGFRMMPSANRILSALQLIRYLNPTIDIVFDELVKSKNSNLDSKDNNIINFENSIEFENISYSYNDKSEIILKNISFSIDKGETIGIVGESGSGKSTLINLFLGLLQPNEGRILVDGEKIDSASQSWQKLIGFVPQSIYLMDDTIKNNIAFGIPKNEIDNQTMQQVIDLSMLNNLISENRGLDTLVGERGVRLSGGQLQRIGIARSLYHNPAILVLDEATNALDEETETLVMESVNKLRGKKTIIIISHRLNTLKNCDKIIRVDKGKVKVI